MRYLLKGLLWLILLLLITISLPVFAKNNQIQSFPLQQVRLLDSPFKHAQDLNIDYVMSFDPDRLLAPFLREAGLESKAESYGNWESSGLDGHIGGHYLSALSLAYASTGEQRIYDRLDYMLSELERAQKASGNGYIGGVPKSKEVWAEIAKGEIHPDLFSLNNRWVPWYNLHKTYAGLRDAYMVAGNERALALINGLGEWTFQLVQNLSDEQIQQMLYAEHGGMNDVFADYFEITGDKKYLDLAYKFSEKRILDPLKENKDQLTGLHANTQIPKVVGFAHIAQLNGDKKLNKAAHFFWDTVVNERSIAIGGNSTREHFHDKKDFSSMVESVQGPETCNTYNMLRLSELLYGTTGDTRFVDYYERALYNHILSSQHPKTGGLVYFTPMRPQHYRVYSQVETSMWCCVGSGIENHVKYGKFIYAHRGDTLFVNLFIPSRLEWKEKDVILRQDNQLPDEEFTRLVIEKGGEFELAIRKPVWLEGVESILLNGQPQKFKQKNGYLKLSRNWQKGDELKIALPMKTRLEKMPDGSNYFAIFHGPVVLSAPVNPLPNETLSFFADDSRMGHVASGQLCPVVDAPLFVSKDQDILSHLERQPGIDLRFKVEGTLRNVNGALELVPFFRVHESRYMLYWQHVNENEFENIQAEKRMLELAELALAERTVDWVAPGEQQPEAEHNFKGERTEAGMHRNRHWRHAYGWFSYELSNPQGLARTLRITLSKADSGREFSLWLNGKLLDEVKTSEFDDDGFYDMEYSLDASMRAANSLEIKVEAKPNSIAGGIYEIRLLKGEVHR